MKRVIVASLAACCACHGGGSSAAATVPARPAEQAPATPSKHDIATIGAAYDLKLDDDVVSFCDQRGPREVLLESGREQESKRSCSKSIEPNTACEGLSLDATVSSPDLGNDVVQVTGVVTPFAMQGHIADCRANGDMLIVATHSRVVTIDAKHETMQTLSDEGGEQVAIAAKWVGWLAGSALHVRAR